MSLAGAAAKDTEVRLPRTIKVKNKAPAGRQITAEQILREAKEIQLEDDYKAPKTIITGELMFEGLMWQRQQQLEGSRGRLMRHYHASSSRARIAWGLGGGMRQQQQQQQTLLHQPAALASTSCCK
jgi:hypothetical protein